MTPVAPSTSPAKGPRAAGSYDDPEALRHSFADAEQVLIVSSSDVTADVLGQHRTAIDAAVAAGAQRILYTSTHGTGSKLHIRRSLSTPPRKTTWRRLEWHGLLCAMASTVTSGSCSARGRRPARSRSPQTDPSRGWIAGDAGEAAAVILTTAPQPDGPVDLTLPTPIRLADFASAASDLAGHRIERIVVDDEEWVASEMTHGVPEPVARFTLSMFQATRSGHFSQTDATLTRLLGREPRGIADQLADQVHA